MTARQVVVIGGGLAGVTAAIGLREAGFDVTLLEARPRLGGAASSFARGDLTIDNGQHVFLRCCTSYQELLARLGVSDRVTMQERFDVTVLSPHGRARLRRTALPGPLHMGRALTGYRLLPLAERLKVARAALALRSLDPADPAIDGVPLGTWLASKGQSERARRMLWDLFIVSALNIGGDEASLALAATVIQMALLGKKDAADIGMAAAPLGDLHGRAAADLLGKLGAQIRLAAKAAAVRRLPGGGFPDRARGRRDRAAGRRWCRACGRRSRGARAAGRRRGAGRSARPGRQAGRRRPASKRRTAGPTWARRRSSTCTSSTTGRSPACRSRPRWTRRSSGSSTRPGQAGLAAGQYLAVSLSAADAYVDIPAASLRQQFLPALERIFPAAAGAKVTDFFVTRERRATFRQAPGIGALRPGTATAVPGFVLAGAWTDTGWPDTMEGAVRSGQRAAEELTRWLAGQPAPSDAGRQEAAAVRTGAPS